jgi:hypothetical protein
MLGRGSDPGFASSLENYAGMPTDPSGFFSFRNNDYCGMVSPSDKGATRSWPRIRGVLGERVFPSFRRIFASEVPECKGDNCLLTRDFAYVDLSFSGLIA